jgi:hypothetical protein
MNKNCNTLTLSFIEHIELAFKIWMLILENYNLKCCVNVVMSVCFKNLKVEYLFRYGA